MNLLQRVRAVGVAVGCALAWVSCTSPNSPPAAAIAPASTARAVADVPPVAPRPSPAHSGRSALVLLSGGGSPFSNHYSQYLQAKAITAYFAQAFPAEPTWVFFGIGNRSGEPAQLADTHHIVERDKLELDTWLPGVLPGNRPATRASFLKALREEILPTVRDGGTLYLFIGDHGELTDGDNGESAVTLWQFKRGSRRRGTWYSDDKEVLTVTDLRQALMEGLGRGRVVFCMTQCHSGGFHYLGVPREMTAPANWFSSVPEWVRTQRPAMARPLPVAGFTATDEESVASGCVSDPDSENWAGYERYAPESLIGVDLMTERRRAEPRFSLAAVHEAATLVDATIDKPRATSEQYLERWAQLIEKRLGNELRLTGKARAAVAAYQRAVETGSVAATGPAFQVKQEQFRRFTARLAEQNSAVRDLVLRGSRKQLEAAVDGRGDGSGRRGARGGGGRRNALADSRKAWTDTLRPAWRTALLAPGATLLSGAALDFEKQLLSAEEGGRNFMLPRGVDDERLLEETYWKSTYAEPANFNPAVAEAVTRWAAERRDRILAWAETSHDPAVRAAAEKVSAGLAILAGNEPAPASPATAATTISRKTAAERALFYRRVLGAWEFLVAMEAKAELGRLEELIALEQMPLPVAVPAAVAAAGR